MFTAGGRSTAALAAFGCIAAVFLPRAHVPLGAWCAAAALLLPVVFPWFAPQIGFIRVDQRVQLAGAWLVLASVLLLRSDGFLSPSQPETEDRKRQFAPAVLFVFWAAVLWLTVVWDVGIGRLAPVNRNAVPSNCGGDVLAWIYGAWDAHSVGNHLFLPWRTPSDYASRTAYMNHSQGYLIIMYVAVKAIQAFTGQPLHYAINLTPFVYMIVSVSVLLVLLLRSGVLDARASFLTLVWLFLLLGVLLTQGRFWHNLYAFSADDPFPLIGACVVLLFAVLRVPTRAGVSIAVAGLLGVLNPFTAPAVLLGVVCLFGNPARGLGVRAFLERNRVVVGSCGLLVVGATVSFLAPRLLILWAGYQSTGSTFVLQSGLDGDARYATSVWQAIVSPCGPACCGGGRKLTELLVPAFVPVIVAGLFAFRDRAAATDFGRALTFVSVPYLFSAILFPRAVSIHPYLYDHLLMMPVTIIGVFAMLTPIVQERLRGATLLVALLVFAGLLMSNLMAISQAIPR